jgi:hypothetical protein
MSLTFECEHFIDRKMLGVVLEDKKPVLECKRWLPNKDCSHRRMYGRQSVAFPEFSTPAVFSKTFLVNGV